MKAWADMNDQLHVPAALPPGMSVVLKTALPVCIKI
jgi:hypothetical protein